MKLDWDAHYWAQKQGFCQLAREMRESRSWNGEGRWTHGGMHRTGKVLPTNGEKMSKALQSGKQ